MRQKTDQLPLFVYGTLQPGASRYPLLRPMVERTVAASLQGYQMHNYRTFPGITPSPSSGLVPVPGYLIHAKPEKWEEFIRQADRVENEGFLFHRVETVVQWFGGKEDEAAWVYIINSDVLKPTQENRVIGNSWHSVY